MRPLASLLSPRGAAAGLLRSHLLTWAPPNPSPSRAVKLNSQDFAEKGLTNEESKQVCLWLDEAGVDLLEISGGSYESMGTAWSHQKESTRKREAYFIEFSAAVKDSGIKSAKVCVTGGFRSKKAMEEALGTGACDLVGLARPLTAEPYLIRDMLEGKTDAARENKFAAGMQTGASIVQIAAISKGEPIPDLSDEKVCDEVLAILQGGADQKKPVSEQDTSNYQKSENKL